MRRLDALLAVAAFALIGLCALLYQALRVERAEHADTRARLVELERSAQALPPATLLPAAPLTPVPAGEAPPSAAAAAAVRATPTTPPELDHRRRMVENMRLRMSDPEYRAAWIAQQRLQMRDENPDLGAELGFSDEQIDRLFDLIAEQRAQDQLYFIERQLIQDPGLETASPEAARERRRAFEERNRLREEEQRALLGEDKYEAWREFQNSRDARAQMQALRGRLAAGTSPLLDGQFDQLVSVLAREQQRMSDEAAARYQDPTELASEDAIRAHQERRLEMLEEYHKRIASAVSAYMSSEQMRQFQAMQRDELERHRAQMRMWRAQRDAKARAGVD